MGAQEDQVYVLLIYHVMQCGVDVFTDDHTGIDLARKAGPQVPQVSYGLGLIEFDQTVSQFGFLAGGRHLSG